jgi:Putative zinc-finger
MNCNHVEELLMDALYGELSSEEQTEFDQHVDSCSTCSVLFATLQHGRTLAQVYSASAPEDQLEARILEASRRAFAPLESPTFVAQKGLPRDNDTRDDASVASFQNRRPSGFQRFLSNAGAWAMRPQTAMAAVFVLMLGSSALLLRRNHGPRSSAFSVSGEGAPLAAEATAARAASREESDDELRVGGAMAHGKGNDNRVSGVAPLQAAPATPPPAPLGDRPALRMGIGEEPAAERERARAESSDGKKAEGKSDSASASEGSFERGMTLYREGKMDEALAIFDALARRGDANAALWAARAVRDSRGCAMAVSRFDQLSGSHQGSTAAFDAVLEGGICYRNLGRLDAARTRISRLLTVPSHEARARTELDTIRRISEKRNEDVQAAANAKAADSETKAGGGAAGHASPKAAPAKPAAARPAEPAASTSNAFP